LVDTDHSQHRVSQFILLKFIEAVPVVAYHLSPAYTTVSEPNAHLVSGTRLWRS
jgi:hypothetical protein